MPESRTKKKRVPLSDTEKTLNIKLKEIHCANAACGDFLGYELLQGLIYIKCHKCKNVTMVTTLPEGTPMPKKMGQYFCNRCGRFLCEEAMVGGIVKVKCRGCSRWNFLEITPLGIDKPPPYGDIIDDRSKSPSGSPLDVRKGE